MTPKDRIVRVTWHDASSHAKEPLMTDNDLNGLYRDVNAFLASPHANLESVSPAEAQWARRMLAVGRSGRCMTCGKPELHAHSAK